MGCNMKLINTKLLLASALMWLPLLANAIEKIPNEELQQARALVKLFGGELKQVLSTAMQADGPLKALEVCNVQAGPIADKNSSLSTWNIARTSLKVRNESNTADEWEVSVLQQFEKRKAAGEDLKTMEYSEIIPSADKMVYRYMKPIPTAGLCTTCHGVALTAEISEKVKLLYPNDRATGFNLGDIRGAFSLEKVKNISNTKLIK